MSKKDVPFKTISELPNDTRKFMRALIREICINNNVYAQAHLSGIGLDETEEAFEALLNRGELKIMHDKDKGLLYVKKWDEKYQEYM